MHTTSTRAAARAIESALRAIGCDDAALFDALAALDNDSDDGEAAGVFEWAGEASTECTEDGAWDDTIDETFDAWSQHHGE